MSETNSVYAAYQGNTYLFGGNAAIISTPSSTFLPSMAPAPKMCRTCP
jgi:hypothetical protein